MRVLLVMALALLSFGRAVFAQELDPDPDRIFVTPLKWKSVTGESRDKSANGTLAILYVEGVYAEVTAAFVKKRWKSADRLESERWVCCSSWDVESNRGFRPDPR
jgi:hypothetical protein